MTPHHLLLTTDLLTGYDPTFKVNPPLRPQEDVDALRAALADGTIDAVATDHAPHARHDKEHAFVDAAFGMLGLETALGVVRTALPDLSWADVAQVMSTTPARIAGLADHGRPLAVGARPPTSTLVDPAATVTVDRDASVSLSRNNPWHGRGADVAGRAHGVRRSADRARRRYARDPAGHFDQPLWLPVDGAGGPEMSLLDPCRAVLEGRRGRWWCGWVCRCWTGIWSSWRAISAEHGAGGRLRPEGVLRGGGKPPHEVRSADVLGFVTAQHTGAGLGRAAAGPRQRWRGVGADGAASAVERVGPVRLPAGPR